MADYEDFSFNPNESRQRLPDLKEREAREELASFFDKKRENVFFSRQLEVRNERKYYHWITNRALPYLVQRKLIRREWRKLATGGSITLLWHRSFRYYRRSATRIIKLVEEYSTPNIGGTLGLHGESMVLEGSARLEFIMRGRNTNEFRDNKWEESKHDLDFIFERDDIAYGIEVKNTLGYMDHDEFTTEIKLCNHLGILPVFAVRMFPGNWIQEVRQEGGFALILGHPVISLGTQRLGKKSERTTRFAC